MCIHGAILSLLAPEVLFSHYGWFNNISPKCGAACECILKTAKLVLFIDYYYYFLLTKLLLLLHFYQNNKPNCLNIFLFQNLPHDVRMLSSEFLLQPKTNLKSNLRIWTEIVGYKILLILHIS